ncbi:polymer-forming cytoskeletal protein [Galbitalea sp. SE-J8]|uniref:polymer-forming cytoskeletal protein n=1 Tax=Galbitalea sp. SE-J8 TaxID=3054952 RepID=UPI00259CF7E4|nr:polymer-forming cytoskeletal protein [Galbitalea sp. SE-J8]MDM4761523.1 polymer-forming cytoskeletal protein [Galbitalea sp. SE-J8]
MIAAIGVLAVAMLITALITSSLVTSLGYTSSIRASSQSQASSEAGIAVARAAVSRGTCSNGGHYSNDVAPIYDVQVQYWTGSTWMSNCPPTTGSLLVTKVRFKSLGTAVAKGVNGVSGNDTRTVIETITRSAVVSNGAALYLYGGGSLDTYTLSASAGTADVKTHGNFTCTSGGSYAGNVTVIGDVSITNQPCTIHGTLWASGKIRIDSGATIDGDVIAAGGDVLIENGSQIIGGSVYANGNFTLKGTMKILGSVEARGTFYVGTGTRIGGSLLASGAGELRGNVVGNVTSVATSGTVTVTPGTATDRRVGGALVVGSWAKYDSDPNSFVACRGATFPQNGEAQHACALGSTGSASVAGAVTIRQAGLAAPVAKSAPTVPDWVEVGADFTPWTNAGYTRLNWSGDCQIGSRNNTSAFWTTVTNLVSPTVIDATSCSEVYLNSQTLSVRTNVAFIAKKITLQSSALLSADGAVHKVDLIVADPIVSSNSPSCSGGVGDVSLNPATIDPKIYGLIYTPCNYYANYNWSTSSGSIWRGQVYAGGYSGSGGNGLIFTSASVPGADLNGAAGAGGAVSDWSVDSTRLATGAE